MNKTKPTSVYCNLFGFEIHMVLLSLCVSVCFMFILTITINRMKASWLMAYDSQFRISESIWYSVYPWHAVYN